MLAIVLLVIVLLVIGLLAMPPAVALLNSIARQGIGFGLTLGLAAIYRRWRWEMFSLWRHGLAVLGFSLAAMFVDMAVTRLIFAPFALNLQPLKQQTLEAAASAARALPRRRRLGAGPGGAR